MDSTIDFLFRHIKAIVAFLIIGILVAWLVSFFANNSIVFLQVTSESNTPKQATIKANNLKPQTVTIGERMMLVIPRDTVNLSAETDEYSTIISLVPPFIAGNVDLSLTMHAQTNLVSTANTDCAYDNPGYTLSWNCNQPQIDLKKTTYTDSSYPSQSFIDLTGDYLEYAKRYGNGFLALSASEGVDVTYTDLSKGDAEPERIPLDDAKFSYEYTILLVDSIRSNNFLILDQKSLDYEYYEGGLGQLVRSGKLPDNLKTPEKGSVAYTFQDGVVQRYSGISSDDTDDHSGADNSSIKGSVARYTLATGTSEPTVDIGTMKCSNVAITKTTIACHDRDIVQIYARSNLKKPILSVSAVSATFSLGDELYVVQESSILRYDASSKNLTAVFKIHDRAIASTYLHNGTIYVSAWFTYPDSRQTRLLYSIDPSKKEDNSAIIKNYPFEIPDTLAYGMDYHNGTIYVKLIDNNELNKTAAKDLLRSKGLLDSTRQLFF
jgi:hypothetical protein